MNPMVSIVVPMYNSSYCLVDCLNSILRQTYNDWEIILIDDCSNDNTSLVVQEYINNNDISSCLRYYQNNRNMGVSATRNIGISFSKGKFISFLDSDDVWYSTKLERVMEVFSKFSEVDLVCHNENMTVDDSVTRKLEYSMKVENLDLRNKALVYKKLFWGNLLSPSAVTIRKRCLEDNVFDETFKVAEDYDLWLRLARNYRFYFLKDYLGEFRKSNANSLSSDRYRLFEALVRVIKKNKVNVKRTTYYTRLLRCYISFLKERMKNLLFLIYNSLFVSQAD